MNYNQILSDKIKSFHIFQNQLTLWMNHLLVVYAFLIPISKRGTDAVFFAILIFFVLRGNFKFYLKDIFSNKIINSFILFFLVHILWLFGTENYSSAMEIIKNIRPFLYPIIFLSFLDKKFAFKILTAFMLSMFYSEALSYLIHFNIMPHHMELFGKEIYTALGVNEPSPFLRHSRYTVLLSITIAILLYNLINLKHHNLLKVFSFLFIITASINLSLVGGRIGYITFFVLIIFVIIYTFRKNCLKPLILVLFSLFIFIALAYNNSQMFNKKINQSKDSVTKLLSNESNNYQSSIGYRIGFWVYSIDTIKDNFLFGVGTGDQVDEVKSNMNVEHKYIKDYIIHSHNEYLKAFLQFGFVGFLCVLNIFYQIIKYQCEYKYKKGLLLIVSLTISMALLTDIFASFKVYITLFITLISALVAKNNFISMKDVKTTPYIIYIYGALISLFCLFSYLQ